jgi:RimJ/RimL family protein N-acetyltransferase
VIHGIQSNLRAVERSDARFICALLNENSTQAGWGTIGIPVSVHAIEQEIEHWLEIERDTRRPHGLIIETLERDSVGLLIVDSAIRHNQSAARLSVAISPESQRQGFGRDALTALIDALFDEWRIHRLEVHCEADNEPTARLYESLGFVREATRRGATFTGGEFHDQHVYGMGCSRLINGRFRHERRPGAGS